MTWFAHDPSTNCTMGSVLVSLAFAPRNQTQRHTGEMEQEEQTDQADVKIIQESPGAFALSHTEVKAGFGSAQLWRFGQHPSSPSLSV